MSQITSIGASVFMPSGFTWVPEIRYLALITADRNIAADGEMHFSVAQRLCRLKNRGTSSNSWKNKLKHKNQFNLFNRLFRILNTKTPATCLGDCSKYSRDPIISRISVFHRFNTVQNRSHPFLIMHWSRPNRPAHVIFLSTVAAFLCHNWTSCW